MPPQHHLGQVQQDQEEHSEKDVSQLRVSKFQMLLVYQTLHSRDISGQPIWVYMYIGLFQERAFHANGSAPLQTGSSLGGGRLPIKTENLPMLNFTQQIHFLLTNRKLDRIEKL